MKPINKVLVKVLVKEFYQANAGFFLVVVGLLFGFLKTPQHMDIASALASNPIYYLIPLVLWSLYALKTYLFAHRIKKLPANSFLTDFVLLPAPRRKLVVIYLQILLLAPTIAYSFLLGSIAYQINVYQSVIYVLSGNFLVLMVTAHFLHNRLIQPLDANSVSKFISWTQKLPKHLSTLFIHHLFNRQPIPLLFTKLLSIGIIIGASVLYRFSQDDIRFLSLGMLLATGINSTLSFKYFEFNSRELKIFGNLPISVSSKFITVTISYALLMIPEIVVLFGNNYSDTSIINLATITLMFLSLAAFYHSIVQLKNMDMDHFVRYPFLLTATLFFVILGYVQPLMIALPFFIISFIIFRKSTLVIREM
jgi:hypothetical protein